MFCGRFRLVFVYMCGRFRACWCSCAGGFGWCGFLVLVWLGLP